MKTAFPFIKENKQTRKKTKTKTTQNNDNNNANLKAHINKQANNSKNNKWNKKKRKKKQANKQNNNNNNNNKSNNNNKLKLNKIIQLLTVSPEFVTLDCSFAHVLQAPNSPQLPQLWHLTTVKSWMDWAYMWGRHSS